MTGAAEAHGILCGVLCAPEPPDDASWLQALLGDVPPEDALAAECRSLLLAARAQAASQLYSGEFSFQPLLPADSEPLAVRAVALGEWCEGFLYGLGLGRIADVSALPPNCREILSDLGEFTQVEPEPEATEQGEAAYTELVEYVRAAVLLLLDELRPEPPKSPRRKILH